MSTSIGQSANPPGPPASRLVLASTSRYRRELLQRLRLPFEVAAPRTDESPLPGETPLDLAVRLAGAKARAVALTTDAWVLGSDQVAAVGGRVLGKPGGRDQAQAQLLAMSGQRVEFLTAISLVHRDGQSFHALDTTVVQMRALDAGTVDRYLDAEQPYDCAGSFKAEGLGIALFESIDATDPTGLIGLPLIATARLLRQAGFVVP